MDSEPKDLSEKFPHLIPVRSAPTMFTVNGCGLALYGQREPDAETRSYLKTLCITLLFIPVYCLRAYRVVDSPAGGWYFLGREPLSLFARIWNLLLLTVVAGVGGVVFWSNHVNSPEYIAEQKLTNGRELIRTENWQAGIRLVHEVAQGSTTHATAAFEEFSGTATAKISEASVQDAIEIIHLGAGLKQRGGTAWVTRLLHEMAQPVIDRFVGSDAEALRGMLPVLSSLTSDAADPEAAEAWYAASRRRIVEAAFQSTPQPALEIVVEYAEVLEADEQFQRCEDVLTPRKGELGSTEGARILGQIFARRGELDAAYDLLMPYMQERIAQLKSVDGDISARLSQIQLAGIEDLNQGRASDAFYSKYDTSNKEQQEAMVEEFIFERVRSDARLRELQQKTISLNTAIPAAIDLGIIQLRRGQAQSDPELRRQELEQAEQTFLAVRGQLGETETYRLFLGQVYFWMGRQDEGRKLFDELLAADRNPNLLMQVAETYRQVGSDSDARQLSEESYSVATTDEQRSEAASIRAVLSIDVNDRIKWLERCDPNAENTRLSLAESRGQQAEQNGRPAEAIPHYESAVAGFEKLPETSAVLNNMALILFRLAAITGNQTHFDRGLRQLERAVALEPDNSVLLNNVTSAIEGAAIGVLAEDQLDFAASGMSRSVSTFRWLYNDEAGYDKLAEKLRNHPGIRRVIDNYEKLTVMAPRNRGHWVSLYELYRYLDQQQDQLVAIRDRLKSTSIDFEQHRDTRRKFVQGEMDEMIASGVSGVADRYQKYLQAAGEKRTSSTAAVLGALIESHLTLASTGSPSRVAEDLPLLQSVYSEIPSSGARQLLMTLHLETILQTAKDQSKVLSDVLGQYRRSLNSEQLLIIALARDSEFAPLLQKHESYRQWVDLLNTQMTLFPEHSTECRCALAALAGDQELAADLKQRLLNNPENQLDADLSFLLDPDSPGSVLRALVYNVLAGNEEETAKCLSAVSADPALISDLELLKKLAH